MKNYILIFFVLAVISCNNSDALVQFEREEFPIDHEMSLLEFDQLVGTWFRTTPIRFAAIHGNPSFERGENHIEVEFKNNGEFEHRYINLGFYENQNPTDSTSITILKGTFTLEDNFLRIRKNSQTYIQIYDGENINRDTSTQATTLQHHYQWPKVELSTFDSLKFTYHTITDVVSPHQISPGIELSEETYRRR